MGFYRRTPPLVAFVWTGRNRPEVLHLWACVRTCMLPLLAAAAAAGANSSCSLPISTNQVVKNARPVEISGWGVAESSEWQDRLELAALARIMYIYGFGSDLAAQCVMARLRDEPDSLLMNE